MKAGGSDSQHRVALPVQDHRAAHYAGAEATGAARVCD